MSFIQRKCFAALLLFVASPITSAAAQTFFAQAKDFCDVFRLTISNGVVVGADIGCGYQTAVGTGIIVRLPSKVAPGGIVASMAGRFNTGGYANEVYIDLKAGRMAFYNTDDGSTVTTAASPVEVSQGMPQHFSNQGLPPMGKPNG